MTLAWHREPWDNRVANPSAAPPPVTFMLTDAQYGGNIFAKVRQDEQGKWVWYTIAATSTGFLTLRDAQAQAENYVTTHPDLKPLNH